MKYRNIFIQKNTQSSLRQPNMFCVRKTYAAGFTALIASLVAAIVLAIGLAILDVTLKQVQLAGVARQSDRAFHAAQAALECARYNDFQISPASPFAIPNDGVGDDNEVECFGSAQETGSPADSGDEQTVEWSWGDDVNGVASPNVCSEISVYKFFNASSDEDMFSVGVGNDGVGNGNDRDCPQGFTCTVIKARGYNSICSEVGNEGVVERELTAVY